MDPRTPDRERWRPDAPFFLVGGPVAFAIGLVVGVLTSVGAGEFHLASVAWSGVAGLFVFLVVCGLLAVTLHQIHRLQGFARVIALAVVFFIGGAIAWLAVHAILVVAGLSQFPTGEQLLSNIALSGVLGILFSTGFYVYEAMRQRIVETASRLKEAEFAEKELELAREIQSRLLPPTELSGTGYSIAARNLPAHYVAGDFFDVFSLPDGSLGLVVADVAGKGVGASLIMASVKAVLPLMAAERTVDESLVALNEKLCDELESRQFVALAYARYEPQSGEIVLANAGLPDPYLLRAGTAAEPLAVDGPRLPLGMRRDQVYQTRRARLSVGQSLLMLTDGLPEAATAEGEPLGYERLSTSLPGPGPEPSQWLETLFADVQRQTAVDLADDWTALLLQRSA
jgi:hypothetical protein